MCFILKSISIYLSLDIFCHDFIEHWSVFYNEQTPYRITYKVPAKVKRVHFGGKTMASTIPPSLQQKIDRKQQINNVS